MAGPLPTEFASRLDSIRQQIRHVDGWLTDREVHFLAVAAACPTAPGRILEIGCYHGKSTIVLAMAASLADRHKVFSVDPIEPEPVLANLRAAGVAEQVLFHRGYSQQFLRTWRQPIRFLWHDGSNRDQEVREDVELFLPHLVDGAIVAFHDILNTSGERIHPYVDQILGSDHFGPAGICGSIGWAQYNIHGRTAVRHQAAKRKLARQLARLQPYHWVHKPMPSRLERYRYKLLRFLLSHGGISPERWLSQVTRATLVANPAPSTKRAA